MKKGLKKEAFDLKEKAITIYCQHKEDMPKKPAFYLTCRL